MAVADRHPLCFADRAWAVSAAWSWSRPLLAVGAVLRYMAETMSDERTVAPSPARWSRAWDAGMRPWSGWLWPAVVCGLLALAIDRLRHEEDAWLELGTVLRPGSLEPEVWLGVVVTALGGVLAVVGGASLVLALVSQRLGWVSTDERERLLPAPARPVVLARVVLCLAVGLGLALALAGVLAGSARAVDASEASLVSLWLEWAQRAFAVLALALGVGAIVDLLLDRRDREQQLWQTPQAARDEARAAGGRSR